jgi:hypothetical protein
MLISQLSAVTSLSAGDNLVIQSAANNDARKASLSVLLAFIEANFASPDFDVTISSPIAGFNQQLATSTSSIWLILTPAGTLATGTVTLPPVADLFDGQEVLVTSSQVITALTVAGNGATVNGAPGALAANGFFRLRYNTLLTSWFCVAQSLGATTSYSTITITQAILDANGNEMFTFDPAVAAVNFLDFNNAATGNNVGISANGSDTDVGITITAKGAGGVAISADSLLASVAFATITGTLDAGVTTVPSIITSATTVGALGSAATKGQRKFVTDSNQTMTAGIGTLVATGGANNVPVYSDGTIWRIG